MRTVLLSSAALLFAVSGFPTSGAVAQDMTEIDKAASELNQILTEKAEGLEGTQEVRVVRARLDPMTIGAWHVHPSPVYVYVMEGEMTYEAEGEEPQSVGAGEAVAETVGARMRVMNRTEEPVEVVVFQISPAEKEFLEEETEN